MTSPLTAAQQAQLRADVKKDIDLRERNYRDRALKLFPHICARCGRKFEGKRLRELTVHHKDQDFKNNPPDGSNWELLCLYCHDDEHAAAHDRGGVGGSTGVDPRERSTIVNPFANLDALVKPARSGRE